MKEINKEEMFGNLKSFLKSKGVDLQDGGDYTHHVRRGCDILTDTVNLSQRGYENAKGAMERGLDQLRQTIHERTAPKSQPTQAQSASTAQASAPPPEAEKVKTAKTSTKSTKASSKKPSRKSKK